MSKKYILEVDNRTKYRTQDAMLGYHFKFIWYDMVRDETSEAWHGLLFFETWRNILFIINMCL